MSRVLPQTLAALIAGSVFGLGLGVSGLADPNNVLEFLIVSSDWSPALLFVMGAGVVVTFIGYRWVLRRGPVFAVEHRVPQNRQLDRRLLAGAAIFGIGWGFAGFCPGPAITSLGSGVAEPAIFLVAMLAGALMQRLTLK